jgi:putative ABC transport system substrate-binding protein
VRAARAQQAAMPVVGFLHSGFPGPFRPYVAGFLHGLAAMGYVEGKNVAIEYGWAQSHYEQLPALAAKLVDRRVAVIVTTGGELSALAAKPATSTIPIVATFGGNPVESGLVASLNRPGGNMTGFSMFINELDAKRLGALQELVPKNALIAALVNPNFPPAEAQIAQLQMTARAADRAILVLTAVNPGDIDAAFAALIQRQAKALVVAAAPFFAQHRDQLVALAARHAVPVDLRMARLCRGWRPDELWHQPDEHIPRTRRVCGSCPQRRETRRSACTAADQLRAGDQPQDGQALGLKVPPSLLARADEVIE